MDTFTVKKTPFIYAISGYKNTGKTTLLEQLIPTLCKKGYQVAVVKHDGHDFTCDVPDTDSYRHKQAGAFGVAVFSSQRIFITREYTNPNEQMLFQAFPDADIILIEGLKHSTYPKYVCDYPNKIPNINEIVEQIEELYVKHLKRR